MKKALFIENTSPDNNLGQIYIETLKKLGYKVDIINNQNNKLEFTKRLFTLKNLKTYKKLKNIIKQNNYEIIHCNNFICGVLTRFATRKQKSKIIYSTNNFCFYKGEFFIKWIFGYLIEKYLSNFTDTIIIGNKEDYVLAKTKYHAKHVKLIKAVKIEKNIEKEKSYSREKYNLKNEDYIFLNIGELNKNENQIMQLEVMIDITKKYKNAKLIILGSGMQKEYLENIIVKYGLEQNVQIIENKDNMLELLNICNCLIETSQNKGKSVNLLQAMIRKKPILATNIKEYRDLLKAKNLFEVKDAITLKNKMIKNIKENKNLETYYNIDKYKLEKVEEKITKIYKT